MRQLAVLLAILVVPATAAAQGAATSDAFLHALRSHCGKAYEGAIINPQPNDTTFVGKRLVMHVRACGDTVRIPFHVGEDRSRTWVLTRSGDGVLLKHDHRHQDGSEDRVTQYGGHSRSDGAPARLEFPADSFTVDLIPYARTNIWTVEITPAMFAYQLRREGSDRRVRIEFDLTREVTPPPAPWGFEN